jgi:hypothetical protein
VTVDPYGGYDADADDGLGGIGRLATSSAAPQSGVAHQGYSNDQLYSGGGAGGGTIYTPQPQHLVGPDTSSLLRSPVSEDHHGYGNGNGNGNANGNGNGYGQDQIQGQTQYDAYGSAPGNSVGANAPPSYGAAMGGGSGVGYSRPEKSGYH